MWFYIHIYEIRDRVTGLSLGLGVLKEQQKLVPGNLIAKGLSYQTQLNDLL